ncbi:putative dihydrofolate reductase protein [Botrytis fragariae]|uniref:Dihydrofolate reductase n=1 Tax=Botrytis fragariae TaxID=1964551 RepID=A0A8H6APP8_9HELO|nr:putative dihydrofolate reductase protein [Botrytis fragariae]KAF5871266.1 putative dihydrofolate reductase protein [Botrytis fragariae]
MSTNSNISAMAPIKEFTLIVAATNKMGVGKGGGLPWTGLRKEMAYFARVTKRAGPGKTNAVVMGRKTWESIPPKFRPLANRANYMISRAQISDSSDVDLGPDAHAATSLTNALEKLGSRSQAKDSNSDDEKEIDRVFIIGGGQIYKASLELKEAKRILLTRIMDDFECDTYFPVQLNEDGTGNGWRRTDTQALREWTGEGEAVEGVKEEGGVKYIFEMWEKVEEP